MKITKISAILALTLAFSSMGALADSWSMSSGTIFGAAGFSGHGNAQTTGAFSGSSLSMTSHDFVATSDAGNIFGRTSGNGSGIVFGVAGASSMAIHVPGLAVAQANAGSRTLAVSQGNVMSYVNAGAGASGIAVGH